MTLRATAESEPSPTEMAGRGAWIRTTPAGLDTGRSPLDTPLCTHDAGMPMVLVEPAQLH
jgi:hypothetical protein